MYRNFFYLTIGRLSMHNISKNSSTHRFIKITCICYFVLLLFCFCFTSFCSANGCTYYADTEAEVSLPIKFNDCTGQEIQTNILFTDLSLKEDGTFQDNTGKISGTWGCNYLDMSFDIDYTDYIDVSMCWGGVPVQLKIIGHATVSKYNGSSTYSGSGMITSQTWTYTYDNCPTIGKKTTTCNNRPFSISATVRRANGSPGDNENIVYDDGNGPGKNSCTGLPNYWINTSTLNLFVQDKVCMYPGKGPQVAMTHSYNADPGRIGMFGKGWMFAYQYGITKIQTGTWATTAVLKKGSGQEINYYGLIDQTPPINFKPASGDGSYDKMIYMGDYWLWIEKDTQWTYRFDKAASDSEFRLSSITDKNNNQLVIEYTSNNLIDTIMDASGRVTAFTYDSNNRVTRMDAPDGRFATYDYDTRHNLKQSIDLFGTKTTYIYDDSGLMTSLSTGDKTTQFQYALVGDALRISSVTDANGKKTTYTMSGSTVTKTDPLGNNTVYTSNSKSFTSSVTDPLSNKVTTEYASGNPISLMDALGNKITKTFDARGNVTKITDAKGNNTSFTYDSNDNVTSTTDALGKIMTFTYDANSNLIKITSPLNNQTAMEYDGNGLMTAITNPNGKKTVFSYTTHGNIATITDSLGYQTKSEYDSNGINRTAVTDERGNKTTFSYDANNRLTRVSNPDGSFKTYSYDCCSMTGMTDEKGNTTSFQRDQVLNLTKVTDPVGSSTEMLFDGNGNLVNIKDALSRMTSNTYDKSNRLIKRSDALSGSISYAYDGNGNLQTLTDERSKQTKFTYDVTNRVVTDTDPLNATVQFVRDELGRVKQITNPQSGVILYHYDDDGRMTEKTYNTQNVATIDYDNNGNAVSVIDPAGTSTFSYSSRNELTGITWQDGMSVSFTYDTTGNISGIQYPGGLSAVYEYDSRNRVQKVTWGGMSISFKYDLSGNLVQETRSNGTTSEYSYDAANRLSGVNHKKGAASFVQTQYTRDAVGNIVDENNTTGVSLTFVPETLNGVYNDANQIATWGGDTYVYDKNGNVSTVTGGHPLSASYDLENRLTSLAFGGTSSAYVYDGLGNRVSKTQGTATTKYHYDHLGRLLFETDQSGNVIASYCYAGASLVSMRVSNGTVYCYHFDKTGNTLALTDTPGNVANAYLYDSFGKVMTQTGTVRNPFTYVGAFGVIDEGNGIYYMKNRYYDAITGKFIQKDPIGFAGGINLYAYVGNNPVGSNDPNGLESPGTVFGARAGSTMYEFLNNGFNIKRKVVDKAPGQLGKLIHQLIPKIEQTMSKGVSPAVRREIVRVALKFAGYAPSVAAKTAVAGFSWPAWIAVQVIEMIVIDTVVCSDKDITKEAGYFLSGLSERVQDDANLLIKLEVNPRIKESNYFGRGTSEILMKAGFKDTSYFIRGFLGY